MSFAYSCADAYSAQLIFIKLPLYLLPSSLPNSVLPTPVGPTKNRAARVDRPEAITFITRMMLSIASSCPMMLRLKYFSARSMSSREDILARLNLPPPSSNSTSYSSSVLGPPAPSRNLKMSPRLLRRTPSWFKLEHRRLMSNIG